MNRERLLLLAGSIAVLCGCSRDNRIVEDVAGNTETVPVPFKLSVASMDSGTGDADITPATRAGVSGGITYNIGGVTYRVQDAGDGSTTEIKNVYVMQFNGTADTARLVQTVYVDNFTEHSDIQLRVSETPNRIVFFANTFNPGISIRPGTTLAELKQFIMARTSTIGADTRELFIFGREEANTGVFNLYPMFNGDVIVPEIRKDLVLDCELRRNIARLDVKVKNSTSGDEAITIESVRLLRIPDVCYGYTNYSDASADAFSAFPTDNFPADKSFGTFDSGERAWNIGGSTEQTFTFYVPFNLRGVIANTDATRKNTFAPGTATRCQIKARYRKGSAEYPITYTFVLGADMTSDFNIKPNTSYSYTFDIQKKGDQAVDARVVDLGPVDYTPMTKRRANCYILNPPASDDLTRSCLIPVDRIREFWGSGEGTTTPSGKVYESNLTKAMVNVEPADKKWKAKIIWTDFDNTDNLLVLSKSEGTGSDQPDPSHPESYDSYFEATVKGGFSGNALIGVYLAKDPAQEILWSWHLWITDYSPDEVTLRKDIIPKDGKYFYNVANGEVHRYNNDSFNKETGSNYGKFIMDRDLGALSVDWDGTQNGPGLIYYQFGRKDPLPFATPLYGTKTSTVSYNDLTYGGKNVPYSVANPTIFITSYNSSTWTIGDKYNPDNPIDLEILWQDPYARPDNHQKSIFDPCPSGWMLPQRGTWDNLNTTASGWKNKGYYCYPDATNLPDSYVYYRGTDYRYLTSGASYSFGVRHTSWSSSRRTINSGYYLSISSSGSFSPSSSDNSCTGCPVRCVQEYSN